jgi:16S rRNA (uracil1498-N3)-methyltransferase
MDGSNANGSLLRGAYQSDGSLETTAENGSSVSARIVTPERFERARNGAGAIESRRGKRNSVSSSRFFVPGTRSVGDLVRVEGGDAHKIGHVLRLRAGDPLEIIDSTGTGYAAVVEVSGASVDVRLVAILAATTLEPKSLQVDLAQAVPKGQKMDFVVEKATELGAGAILPFYSERAIVQDLGESKLERWRRLAKTAAQQCGRRDIPPVSDALGFSQLLDRMGEYDRTIFAWELAAQIPLRDRLPELLSGIQRVLLVIGPEGGFSHDEAQAAEQQGASLVWLGTRILRTETAGLALLAVISALTE